MDSLRHFLNISDISEKYFEYILLYYTLRLVLDQEVLHWRVFKLFIKVKHKLKGISTSNELLTSYWSTEFQTFHYIFTVHSNDEDLYKYKNEMAPYHYGTLLDVTSRLTTILATDHSYYGGT